MSVTLITAHSEKDAKLEAGRLLEIHASSAWVEEDSLHGWQYEAGFVYQLDLDDYFCLRLYKDEGESDWC